MKKYLTTLVAGLVLVLAASLSCAQVLDCFECKTWNGSDRIYFGECGEGQATNTVTAFDYESGSGYCLGSCPHDWLGNRPDGLVIELCNCPDTLDQVTFFVSGNEGDATVDALAEYRVAATILTDGVYWADYNMSTGSHWDGSYYFLFQAFNTTDDLCACRENTFTMGDYDGVAGPGFCCPDDEGLALCEDQDDSALVEIFPAMWSADHPCYQEFAPSFVNTYFTYDCDDCSAINTDLEKKILSEPETLLDLLADTNSDEEDCANVQVDGTPYNSITNFSGLFSTEATVFLVDIPSLVYDPTVVVPGTEVQVLLEFLKLGEQGGVICADCPEEFICSCTKTVGIIGCQGGCTYCFPFLTAVEAGDFWDGIAISNYSGIAGTATLKWMGGGNTATTTLEVPAGSIATTTLTEQASALAAQGMAMDVGLILEVELAFTGDAFVFIASQGEGGSFAQGYLPRPGGCDDCSYESRVYRLPPS